MFCLKLYTQDAMRKCCQLEPNKPGKTKTCEGKQDNFIVYISAIEPKRFAYSRFSWRDIDIVGSWNSSRNFDHLLGNLFILSVEFWVIWTRNYMLFADFAISINTLLIWNGIVFKNVDKWVLPKCLVDCI